MYLGCAQVSEHILTSPRLAPPELGQTSLATTLWIALLGKYWELYFPERTKLEALPGFLFSFPMAFFPDSSADSRDFLKTVQLGAY